MSQTMPYPLILAMEAVTEASGRKTEEGGGSMTHSLPNGHESR